MYWILNVSLNGIVLQKFSRLNQAGKRKSSRERLFQRVLDYHSYPCVLFGFMKQSAKLSAASVAFLADDQSPKSTFGPPLMQDYIYHAKTV